MEHFLTKLQIDNLRHLKNIDIKLSETNRQHLLLTGKNGSGKTSVLEAMKDCLTVSVIDKKFNPREIFSNEQFINEVAKNGLHIIFNTTQDLEQNFISGKFILAYFPAGRKADVILPKGVEDIKFSNFYHINQDPAQNLMKYMVHLKTQQAYARQANDSATEKEILAWFERFEKALSVLLDNDTISLEYDYKNYNFLIHQAGRIPFGFNELSDGYSSVIQIMSGIMLRMERNWLLEGNLNNYDLEGIVLIDELETHLHIELQRKILPFLISAFPHVQFVVSTHSPYILTSVSNAVIYDLEKNVTFTDMSNYSIDNVAEAYFDSEDYSIELERKLREYKSILEKSNPTESERIRRAELRNELKNVNGILAERIKNEFDDIEARRN